MNSEAIIEQEFKNTEKSLHHGIEAFRLEFQLQRMAIERLATVQDAEVQQLNMTTMAKSARDFSTAKFFFAGLDPQVERIYQSRYSLYIAMKGFDGIRYAGNKVLREEQSQRWTEQWKNPNLWAELTADQYRSIANKTDHSTWKPGALGVQGDDNIGRNRINSLYAAERIFFKNDFGFLSETIQPKWDNYQRDLDWVSLGLWNTFTGVDDTHIKELYKRVLNPAGGWRAYFDRVPGDFPDPNTDDPYLGEL